MLICFGVACHTTSLAALGSYDDHMVLLGWGKLSCAQGGSWWPLEGGGVWDTDICDRIHVRSQLTVFFSAYMGRSNCFSPDVFLLAMHRVLWRIHICMQSMKKTGTTTTATAFHPALDLPLAGYKKFFCKKLFPPLMLSTLR